MKLILKFLQLRCSNIYLTEGAVVTPSLLSSSQIKMQQNLKKYLMILLFYKAGEILPALKIFGKYLKSLQKVLKMERDFTVK